MKQNNVPFYERIFTYYNKKIFILFEQICNALQWNSYVCVENINRDELFIVSQFLFGLHKNKWIWNAISNKPPQICTTSVGVDFTTTAHGNTIDIYIYG